MAVTFDDMTKCLKQYLLGMGIDEKYIHITDNTSKAQWQAGSLIIPIFGINSDPHAHSLLYGRKTQYPYKKFIELRDSGNTKLISKEIHTIDEMLTFLSDKLTPAINLNDKVDKIIQQLDNLLILLQKPAQQVIPTTRPSVTTIPKATPRSWSWW